MDLIGCNSELLRSINDRATLGEYFPTESVIKHAPLVICGDKLALQNKDIYNHYMDSRPVDPKNPFNTRSLKTASLQNGYARNIDIDSELKCINYYGDKCFYDRYKVNPHKPPTSFQPEGEPNNILSVANVIVHDYANFRKERLSPRQLPGCLDLEKFPECNHPTSAATRQLYQLPSASDNHCLNWGCQQSLNNFTKRKLLSPFNDIQDLNPEKLSCDRHTAHS